MARHAFALLALSLLACSAGAIVGGRPAQDGDAPWMVAIVNIAKPVTQECLDSGGSTTFCQQICGGTLISPDWVLTAAHCLINTPYQDLRVLPGITNLNAPGLADRYIAISDARLHPDAPVEIETYYRNDLALLRLATPATLMPASIVTLEALEALEGADPVADDGVTVFGWGQLGPDAPFPARLQRVSMEMPPSACSSAWSTAPWDYDIWACSVESDAGAIEADDAGDATPLDESGEGICVLDSGGPLVVGNPYDGLLAGVVSWGQQDQCGDAAYPTAHTRVPHYIAWIEAATLAGGAPLQDVGLEVTAPTSASATDTPAVVVTLRNMTASADVPAPSFSLRYSGSAQLSLSGTSQLNCSAVSGGWDCNFSGGPAMTAGGSATVTLQASAPGANRVLAIEAALTAYDSDADYRRSNDRITHRIAFTGKPDLQLGAAGVTGSDGARGWIVAQAGNASAHSDATGTRLIVKLPEGITLDSAAFADGSAISCSGNTAITCPLGNLAAGAQSTVVLSVTGKRNSSGTTTLSLQASEGDYPSRADGRADAAADVTLTWGTPPADPGDPEPEPPAAGGGGGGGAPGVAWLVVLGALAARRKRHA